MISYFLEQQFLVYNPLSFSPWALRSVLSKQKLERAQIQSEGFFVCLFLFFAFPSKKKIGMKGCETLGRVFNKCLFILTVICNQNSKPMPTAHNRTLILRTQLLFLLSKTQDFVWTVYPSSMFNTRLKLGKSLPVLWNSILPPKRKWRARFSRCALLSFMPPFQKFSLLTAVVNFMSLRSWAVP